MAGVRDGRGQRILLAFLKRRLVESRKAELDAKVAIMAWMNF